jgi:hypothetical protein
MGVRNQSLYGLRSTISNGRPVKCVGASLFKQDCLYFEGRGKGQDHGLLGCDTVWICRREIKTSAFLKTTILVPTAVLT